MMSRVCLAKLGRMIEAQAEFDHLALSHERLRHCAFRPHVGARGCRWCRSASDWRLKHKCACDSSACARSGCSGRCEATLQSLCTEQLLDVFDETVSRRVF
jgi:hypothetical protein